MSVTWWRAGVVILALACDSEATGPPPLPLPAVPSSTQRVAVAVNELNAAIAAFYQDGGRVEQAQLIWPDAIPPDPTLPPSLVLFLREP